MVHLACLKITKKLSNDQISRFVEGLESSDFIIKAMRVTSKDLLDLLLFINMSPKII